MRVTNRAFAIFAAAGIALPLNHQLALQPESTIWVAGGSTVRDYKCVAKTINAEIFAPSAATDKLEVSEFVKSAAVAVEVAQLDCGNGKMNEHMRNALKEKQFPKVEFVLAGYTVAGEDIALNGKLTIAGKEQAITFPAKVTDIGGTVRAVATKQIKMSEWGVKPPSLMLGAMKVKDDVTIGFDVALKR